MNRNACRIAAAIAALCISAASPGCGLILETGIWYALTAAGKDDPAPENTTPSASQGQVISPAPLRLPVEYRYRLADAEGDPANVLFEYSTDLGQTWLACSESAGPPGEGLSGLSAPAAGALHTFLWDLQSDLPSASNWNVRVNIRVSPSGAASGEQGSAFISPPFFVNVNHDPVAAGFTPEGNVHAPVTMQYILIDLEDDAADISPAFSIDNGASWNPASRSGALGEGTTGLAASAGGSPHVFVWDSASDLPGDGGQNADVQFRLRPSDPSMGWTTGNEWVSGGFIANYNAVPGIEIYTPSGYFPTTVTLNYTLSDAENQSADVDIEFAVSTGPSTFGPWATATDAGGASEGKTGLSAPSGGAAHVFVWNSSLDVAAAGAEVKIRARARDSAYASVVCAWSETEPFFINNSSTLPWATVLTPAGAQVFLVTVNYSLYDLASSPADVAGWYSVAGGAWKAATLAAGAPEGLAGLATSPGGTAHVFLWDSVADEKGLCSADVRFKIIPYESGLPGSPGISGRFTLDNKRIETVSGGATGPFNNQGGIAVSPNGLIFIADTNNHRIKVYNSGTSQKNIAGISVPAGSIAVIAGTGNAGFNSDNLPGTQTHLNFPSGIALTGSAPPDIIVADSLNSRIRIINGVSGYVSTIAGTGKEGKANDGNLATTVDVRQPRGVAVGPTGLIYVADTMNDCIRLVNTGTTAVTICQTTVNAGCLGTVAGVLDGSGSTDNCTASTAKFLTPWGIAVDPQGNMYVSDTGNHWIRAANAQTVSITVGNVSIPTGFVRKVAGGNVNSAGYAGDGGSAVANVVRLNEPRSVALDASGNLIIADGQNHILRAVNAASSGGLTIGAVGIAFGNIARIAGTATTSGFGGDGSPAAAAGALLDGPRGVFMLSGIIYAADTRNSHIRAVNSDSNSSNFVTIGGVNVYGTEIETIAGSGGGSAVFSSPRGLALAGQEIYIADPAADRIYRHNRSTGVLSVAYGSGVEALGGDGMAATAPQVRFNNPEGVSTDSFGNVCICDTGNNRLRMVNRQSVSVTVGAVTILAGNIDTISPLASISGPVSCRVISSVSQSNPVQFICIADTGNHRIARLDGSTGVLTTIAGTSGTSGFSGDGVAATSATLNGPTGIDVDSAGNLYICDTGNFRIRAVNMQAGQATICGVLIQPGCIATIAGTGSQTWNGDGIPATTANLGKPCGISLLPGGDPCFVDSLDQRIRAVSASSGIIRTVCGTGTAGYNGNLIPAVNSQVNGPEAMTADAAGMIFFSDTVNLLVRRFFP